MEKCIQIPGKFSPNAQRKDKSALRIILILQNSSPGSKARTSYPLRCVLLLGTFEKQLYGTGVIGLWDEHWERRSRYNRRKDPIKQSQRTWKLPICQLTSFQLRLIWTIINLSVPATIIRTLKHLIKIE